jgi:acyl carrier protein
MTIQDKIATFIAREMLFDEAAQIDPKVSLLDSGTIDSTGAMDLVMFLEETFGFPIADEELVPDNLDSVEKIGAFVTRKLQGRSS